MDRSEIVLAARRIYASKYAAEINESQGCLFWAAAFNEAASLHGVESIIQAGSAQFQFRADDGQNVTHFSYVFEPKPAMIAFKRGLLPEMHVWNYVRSTKEIVDLTTCYLPEQARTLGGFQWSPDYLPPTRLWRPVADLHGQRRFIYTASALAIGMAFSFLAQFRERRAA